jgi:hypothetical protein
MPSTGSSSSTRVADVAPPRAEIVVAMSAANDVKTAGAVARALAEGVSRHFGGRATRVVLADPGSTDGTRQAVRDAVGSLELIELPYERGPDLGEPLYHGQPGRAAALRAVLDATREMGAQACAVFDAAMQTLEPDAVERLVGPVIGGKADYVAPYYLRHVNEGAITRSIVYPMFRSLYGVRLRQPAAGEFGCSGPLVAHLLDEDVWDVEQASVGIDLRLAVAAACGDFRIEEAVFGVRRALPRGPAPDLGTTLVQVVGALFADLDRRADVWQRVRGSAGVPVIGVAPPSADDVPVGADGLFESFRLGYRELREVWTWVLPPRTIVELRKLTEGAPAQFRFDDQLWADIVYDFALGYAFRVLPREHLLRSLAPLYAGWLASFVLQMQAATAGEVDARVEQLCQAFEAEKPHLISRWRWPERLR